MGALAEGVGSNIEELITNAVSEPGRGLSTEKRIPAGAKKYTVTLDDVLGLTALLC